MSDSEDSIIQSMLNDDYRNHGLPFSDSESESESYIDLAFYCVLAIATLFHIGKRPHHFHKRTLLERHSA